MRANESKRTKQTEKDPCTPGLLDKPIVQEIKASIPLSLEKVPDTKEPPTTYNKEYCGRIYSVEDRKYYHRSD